MFKCASSVNACPIQMTKNFKIIAPKFIHGYKLLWDFFYAFLAL